MNEMALNVRVTPDVVAKIDQVAELELRSRSSAVRILLSEALRERSAQTKGGRDGVGSVVQ